ncbi:MAG: ATP-dependent helicase [Lachnospiraceae bacterium]|nr:ATP-dependent helicase [Lachnospiraceae bacterium]
MKQRLDETQQCAVKHGEGPLLVSAGPGSGKTTVITHHIKYLIENLGIPPQEILVITFTKSAATEMKERFLSLTGERSMQVVFGTFHAIFYQILRRSGGFDHNSILKENEKYTILRDILKAQKVYFYENTFAEDLLGEISQVKNKNDIKEFQSTLLEKEVFQTVFHEYQRRKISLHKIDFDDMVVNCYQLLLEDANVLRKWQESFRFILVDEFQDINPMQYEIVKLLAESHHNIFAVGDEDQSIYSFRGANPKISFQFLKDYPEAKQLFLSINYRSDKGIVESAKRLISHNKDRFDKDIRANDDSEDIKNFIKENKKSANEIINLRKYTGDSVQIKYFQYEQESYVEIAQHLKEMKSAHGLSKCAVLFRTNMISPLFFQELKKNNIPYSMKAKSKDWKENMVVKDMLAYFSLAEGDLSRKHFYRIMNKPVRFISRDMISKEYMTWALLEENAKRYFSVLEQVRKLHSDLEYISRMPVFAALGYIRRGIGYEKWLKEQGGKVCQEGLETLDMLKNIASDCETFKEFREVLELSETEQEECTEDAVEIMTYHGAKGLEWPVVFLPDVVEGNVPYKRAHTKEEIEEERRMFYVAFTRAKEKVYIHSLNKDERHKKSPSEFLKELKGE